MSEQTDLQKFGANVPPQEKLPIKQEKSKLARWLLISIVVNVIIITTWIIILFQPPLTIWDILYILVSTLIFFSNIAFFWIMIYFHKRRIKNRIVETFNENYIVAKFLTNTKRIETRIVPINKDGISFSIGKREYIVDKKPIWFDEQKRPVCFYFPELPNPLLISPSKVIERFFEGMATDKRPNVFSLENDIAFSSENLQLFKESKIFHDMNKQEETVSQKTFTSILVALGSVCGLLALTLLIMAVVK